ncbi:hypothetical protein V1264_005171 [Littorina saxatilis]|uniref:Uncharacterized protein n=1 Tax=Littorina saxatilis TaxID=31220 RepID=A0AAN9G570_9CAEN
MQLVLRITGPCCHNNPACWDQQAHFVDLVQEEDQDQRAAGSTTGLDHPASILDSRRACPSSPRDAGDLGRRDSSTLPT